MTKLVLKQYLLLSFLILCSAIPLWGDTDHLGNSVNSPTVTRDQKNTREKLKENRYKKYMPHCATIVKNIPHIFSFTQVIHLLDLYREGEPMEYSDVPLLIGSLISCITSLENIYKDIANRNHKTQHNIASKRNPYSDHSKIRISWNLAKMISYPPFIISKLYNISICPHKNCHLLTHLTLAALAISTGYDTLYKPTLELRAACKANKDQKNETQNQNTPLSP